ncbi:osmosensitive K+ channel histidine kinase, partial [Malacoplasma iowae DK-CPA]
QHQRPETEKLLKGLEIIPNKKIEYKNNLYEEFDIDKAIARKPAIILVDELAHTNINGSRNNKRYLDVLELLDLGIDVYTTMNVQHLESVNDIVTNKTLSNVRETVPDYIFDNADEVELVDIDPKDLLERLKSGKIYNKERITTALENFFTIKNLNILREMSLRQSADKILKFENKNIESNEEVVVLITPSPSSQKNIREASRMAELKHTTFTAIYVEKEISDKPNEQMKNHMDLVEKLGGKLMILYGDDVLSIVVNYIKLHKIKTTVLGATWSKFRSRAFETKLMTLLPDNDFYIVPYNQKKITK